MVLAPVLPLVSPDILALGECVSGSGFISGPLEGPLLACASRCSRATRAQVIT